MRPLVAMKKWLTCNACTCRDAGSNGGNGSESGVVRINLPPQVTTTDVPVELPAAAPADTGRVAMNVAPPQDHHDDNGSSSIPIATLSGVVAPSSTNQPQVLRTSDGLQQFTIPAPTTPGAKVCMWGH